MSGDGGGLFGGYSADITVDKRCRVADTDNRLMDVFSPANVSLSLENGIVECGSHRL